MLVSAFTSQVDSYNIIANIIICCPDFLGEQVYIKKNKKLYVLKQSKQPEQCR